jgi:hypothetical protein
MQQTTGMEVLESADGKRNVNRVGLAVMLKNCCWFDWVTAVSCL